MINLLLPVCQPILDISSCVAKFKYGFFKYFKTRANCQANYLTNKERDNRTRIQTVKSEKSIDKYTNKYTDRKTDGKEGKSAIEQKNNA